ncbi:cationic amino acid transporter 4-like isoform X2 [Tubulanus polymorphus]
MSSDGKCHQGAVRAWTALMRTKTLDKDLMETPLKRCLSTIHLTFFGIGQMAGAGVYVLTGAVAKDHAGPATFLSYILAGIVAFLSALSYAEFGARVPKAGSAYTYAYVTVGEVLAFIIGWNLLLEHCIGAAGTARAWSATIDSLANGAIRNGTIRYIGTMNTEHGLAEYPDFVGPLLIIGLAICVAFGVEASMNLNSLIAFVNIIVTIIVVIVGFTHADVSTWSSAAPEGVKAAGSGGFLPHGFGGVLAGAAMCFFAYIGFDSISIAGEETKNPAKSIPIANGVAVTVVTIIYIMMSLALTLMIPYYKIDPNAAFSAAFQSKHIIWAKITVSVGAIIAITGTTLGNMFSVPRCSYAMASDGLIFRCLAYVHPKTQTPIISIAVFTLISCVLNVILDVEHLTEFVSLGTLIAVTFVSICVIILRYQTLEQCQFKLEPVASIVASSDDDDTVQLTSGQTDDGLPVIKKKRYGLLKERFETVPIVSRLPRGTGVATATLVMCVFMILLASLILFCDGLYHAAWWAIILTILASLGVIVAFTVITMHEQNTEFLTFQMPLVPLLPAISVFLNIIFLMKLSYLAWIRFSIWMLLGFLIYFSYGVWHSKERTKPLSTQQSVTYNTNSDQTTPTNNDVEPLEMTGDPVKTD